MSDYYQEISQKTSQGDILELAPHCRLASPVQYLTVREGDVFSSADSVTDKAIAQTRREFALVLSPDCDIDKEKTLFWLLCPIHPLSAMNGSDQGNIRKNKVFNYIFLPAHKSLPDSFVNLGWITTVEARIVKESTRIMTLSDLSRSSLYMQLVRWISRWKLNEVQCPKCELKFNPADTLSVRAD